MDKEVPIGSLIVGDTYKVNNSCEVIILAVVKKTIDIWFVGSKSLGSLTHNNTFKELVHASLPLTRLGKRLKQQ